MCCEVNVEGAVLSISSVIYNSCEKLWLSDCFKALQQKGQMTPRRIVRHLVLWEVVSNTKQDCLVKSVMCAGVDSVKSYIVDMSGIGNNVSKKSLQFECLSEDSHVYWLV